MKHIQAEHVTYFLLNV